MNELIKAQEEYIQFLEKEVGAMTIHCYATQHDDVYERGAELRKNIEAAKPKKMPYRPITLSGIGC